MESHSQTKKQSATDRVCLSAFRSIVKKGYSNNPSLSFDLKSVMPDGDCSNVDSEFFSQIEEQIIQAYHWCSENFPLCYTNESGQCFPIITNITVGKSAHKSELLTASSIQNQGNMILVADWLLPSKYRLGSLFAHEATHQTLFKREMEREFVRTKSIGYSPWKGKLRKGRLIWHSFWAFTCQFSFLGEQVLLDEEIQISDKRVFSYLIEMYSKIYVCWNELQERSILVDEEKSGCESAFNEITVIMDNIADSFNLRDEYSEALNNEIQEYSAWAHSMLNDKST